MVFEKAKNGSILGEIKHLISLTNFHTLERAKFGGYYYFLYLCNIKGRGNKDEGIRIISHGAGVMSELPHS